MPSLSETWVGRQIDALREEPVWHIFADISRIHITTIAALSMFTFGWLFVGVYPWLLTAVCALDWYIVNLINRTVDLEEDRANEISGTLFVQRYRKILLWIVFPFLLVSLLVVHFLNPAITALRIACHLLGIFYNFPLLPEKRRLKQRTVRSAVVKRPARSSMSEPRQKMTGKPNTSTTSCRFALWIHWRPLSSISTPTAAVIRTRLLQATKIRRCVLWTGSIPAMLEVTLALR